MTSLISTSIRLLTAIHFALRIPEFRNQLILVALMLPTGVTFHSATESWTWLAVLYFAVITLTTAGAGLLHSDTMLGLVHTSPPSGNGSTEGAPPPIAVMRKHFSKSQVLAE